MRVFVTGATGFIGTPLVKELIANGHQVLGLTRSDEGAKALQDAGASVHHGSLENLESLKSGARAADAVIHLAFNHDFSKFEENCQTDRQAIEAMGEVLADTNKPLITTSGTAGIGWPGEIATENDKLPAVSRHPRISEKTTLEMISKGVSAAVMRLPQVHDPRKQGLITYWIQMVREKGKAAYINDGNIRWPAAHVSDVAHLYRLALEQHETGAIYHAVAEEGVRMKDIAQTVSQGLGVPLVSIPPEEAPVYFGWLAMFTGQDMPASGALTRKKLGWSPTGPGMIADLEKMDYSVNPLA